MDFLPFFHAFSLVLCLLGMSYIVWSFYSVVNANPKTFGRVRCVEKQEDGSGPWYAPIIEFEWNGEKIVLENFPKRRGSPIAHAGATVPLYFPRYAPRLASLEPVSIPLVAVSAFLSVLSLMMSISLM
jgi:hypothetical protein